MLSVRRWPFRQPYCPFSALVLTRPCRVEHYFTFDFHALAIKNMANQDEMRRELAKLADADLIFMLSEHGIPLEVQHKMAKRGLKSIGRYAALEDKREAFRETIAAIAEIDVKDNPVDSKIMLSDLVQAWEAANHTVKAELESKASHAASGSDIPLPIPKRTYHAMEAAFKEQNGKIKDSAAPGLPLMALTLDMVESNAPLRRAAG